MTLRHSRRRNSITSVRQYGPLSSGMKDIKRIEEAMGMTVLIVAPDLRRYVIDVKQVLAHIPKGLNLNPRVDTKEEEKSHLYSLG